MDSVSDMVRSIRGAMSIRPQLRVVESTAPADLRHRAAAGERLGAIRAVRPVRGAHRPAPARPRSDVDDLIQDVFIAAMRQRHQVRAPEAFRSCSRSSPAHRAPLRAQAQAARARRHRHARADARVRDSGMSPERRALLTRVYQVLDKIPVDQRIAWTLRYVEGEKLEEVAERCGCSLATAKRRIAAAHGRLEAELHDG